jgi:hypothetical protein
MEGNIDANMPLALQLAAARTHSSTDTNDSQTAAAAAALRAQVRVAELKWGDDSPLLTDTEQPYDLILCSVSAFLSCINCHHLRKDAYCINISQEYMHCTYGSVKRDYRSVLSHKRDSATIV